MSTIAPSATQISITAIVPIFAAIGSRNWEKFKDPEADFVNQYGLDTWQEVFNFRLKPALDKDSDRWLLVQWCSEGIISVKNVA